jgi:sec-independent protein translocase protein TatB
LPPGTPTLGPSAQAVVFGSGAAVFDSIGWGEVIVLALAALFIFGPERLPSLAKDAAAGIKRARQAISGVRAQMNESLGDDLADLRDLDLRKYHPRTFIREQLFGDDDSSVGLGDGTGSGGLGRHAAGARPAVRPRDAGTPPPFDLDAT